MERLHVAVDRVEDYLTHLPEMGGIDHERIHTIGTVDGLFTLRASDVQLLLDFVKSDIEYWTNSDRDIMASLRHEACEAHCTECGACDWRPTGPMSDEAVPMINGLCPDCLPQS